MNLQEKYSSRAKVAHQELNDAKARFNEAIRNTLCYGMSDEEVIKIISDHFILALAAINCIRKNNYSIAQVGYDNRENILLDYDEIMDTLNSLAPEPLRSMEDFENLVRSLDCFLNDTDGCTVKEHVDFLISLDGLLISLVESDIEYHDNWEYSEFYSFNTEYKEFYFRLEELMKDNFESILSSMFDGERNGVFFMIENSNRSYEILKEMGVVYHQVTEDPSLKKEVIRRYCNLMQEGIAIEEVILRDIAVNGR